MRQGFALFAGAALVAASLPLVRKHDETIRAWFGKARVAMAAAAPAEKKPGAVVSDPTALADIDLGNMDDRRDVITAPGRGKRNADLTLDPIYQQAAATLLTRGQMYMGAIVLTEVATGRVLAWASINPGRRRDLCLEAVAPSASVFKIVTGSALVEQGVPLNEKYCYGGGEHSITRRDLEADPDRDKWCASVGMAMGRSINAVFARLALRHVERDKLRSAATRLGYGVDVPFDVPVAQASLDVPEDDLEYARMAAGFWHTTLSPFQANNLALTIANGGEMIRMHIVERVVDADNKVLYLRPQERQVVKRSLDERTAWAVARMMEQTVANGTSFQTFHDRAGRPFLPDIRVAGKTGTLTEKKSDTLYTWWVGFAPARSPEVALSVLVVNRGEWHVKATHLAADMLRTYFADKGQVAVRPPPGVRLRSKPKAAASAKPGGKPIAPAGSGDPAGAPAEARGAHETPDDEEAMEEDS